MNNNDSYDKKAIKIFKSNPLSRQACLRLNMLKEEMIVKGLDTSTIDDFLKLTSDIRKKTEFTCGTPALYDDL